MNYEKDIEIDSEALDIEWLEQAALMMKYTKHSATMRNLADKAKEKLGFVRAEINSAIRRNPEKYKIDKVTEGAISEALLLQKEYQTANTNLMDAEFEAEVARGAVVAFSQRKDALENLVRLHGQSYFAGPKIPRNLSEERAAKQEEDQKLTERIGQRMVRQRGR